MKKLNFKDKNLIEATAYLHVLGQNARLKPQEQFFIEAINRALDEVKKDLSRDQYQTYVLKPSSMDAEEESHFEQILKINWTSPSGINVRVCLYMPKNSFSSNRYYLTAIIFHCKRSINFFQDIQNICLLIARK